MKGYGQFCPVAKAASVFCERWTPLILRDLASGVTRFSDLQRGVPLMSPSLLSRRLKQLEAEGIVERRRSPGGSAWTYHLTDAGHDFAPIVEALGVWGQRWSRRDLTPEEIDLKLLVWAMERGVAPKAFGPGRTVVKLEFTDQPRAKRFWWFVNDGDQVDLCLEEPGFEVNLYLAASLADVTRLWRGDISLRQALDSGRLEAHGPRRLCRALAAWLNLGPLASVPSCRADARS